VEETKPENEEMDDKEDDIFGSNDEAKEQPANQSQASVKQAEISEDDIF
jgi:hypothetical protein